MYPIPIPYLHPYYVNPVSINSSNNLLRTSQEGGQQLIEIIQDGIKREASVIDFYSRLVNFAPSQNHKNDILKVLEDEKVHWHKLTNLYMTLTGRQPVYQIEKIPFRSYQEGLQTAYEVELANHEECRNDYLSLQNSEVGYVFLQASTVEMEHAKRFGFLKSSLGNDKNLRKDHGPEPYVVNIEKATKKNNTYRSALWTGRHLQVTLMSINVGEDIGLEVHPTDDQFLRIEQGQGIVQMGDFKDQLNYVKKVSDNFAIMVPAGKWHNVTNTGNIPLKLYSIYAPPHHPHGTVHVTKADAIAAERSYGY